MFLKIFVFFCGRFFFLWAIFILGEKFFEKKFFVGKKIFFKIFFGGDFFLCWSIVVFFNDD